MPVKFSDFSSAGGDGNWDGFFFFFLFFFFLLCMHHSEMCGSLCFLCHFVTRPVHQTSASIRGAQSERGRVRRCAVLHGRSLGLMFRSWDARLCGSKAGGCDVYQRESGGGRGIMHFLLWLNEDLNNLGHYFNILGFLLKELAAVPEVEQNTLSVLLLFTCCRVNGPLCNSK